VLAEIYQRFILKTEMSSAVVTIFWNKTNGYAAFVHLKIQMPPRSSHLVHQSRRILYGH
jgi:hypothetical protein